MLQWTAGQYEFVRELGEGTLGRTFLVRDRLRPDRLLVLKEIEASLLSSEESARLRRFLESLRHVRHPAIARVFEVEHDEADGICRFTRDYVPGGDFPTALKQASDETVVEVLGQILKALAHLHAAGLPHGNLKAANVLVEAVDGGMRVKLLDGTPLPIPSESSAESDSSSAGADLEALGRLLGALIEARSGRERDGLGRELLAFRERLEGDAPRGGFTSVTEALSALATATRMPRLAEPVDVREGACETSRFVGRDTELRRLQGILSRVNSGGGGLVFVEGAQGMGKSRILEELRVQASLAGFTVAATACRKETSGPLSPTYDLLRQLAESVEAEDPVVAAHLERLQKILPGLDGAAGADALPGLPPEQQWLRMKNAIVEFLCCVGEARPLLLLLDDFHWVDEATFSLLMVFATEMASVPVLVVGSVAAASLEENDVTPAPELRELLAGEGVEVLHLAPLDEEAVRELMGGVFALPGHMDEMAPIVMRLTGGVPLHVEELLRSLRLGETLDAGSGMEGDEHEWPSGGTGAGKRLKGYIEARLARLPRRAREALDVLSIFDGPVSSEMLAHVAAKDLAAISEDIDLLECRSLVWATRFAEGVRVEIRNALLQSTVSAALGAAERAAFHDRALDFLLRLQAEGASVRAAELAFHALRGSSGRQALEMVVLAAREAAELHAHDRARRYFWTALEKAEDLGADEARLEILSEMAVILERLGDLDEARSVLERLRSLQPEDASVLIRIGDILRMQGRYQEALELFERARSMALHAGDEVVLCRLERAVANCLYRQGRYEEALGRLEHAAALLEEHGGGLELARTYTTIGLIHWYHGDLDDALASHREGLRVYLAQRDRVGVATSHVNIGLVLWNRGRLQEALARFRRAEALAREVGHFLILAVAQHNRGIIEFELGRLDDARRTLTAGLRMRRQLSDRPGQAKAMDTLGLVHLHAGRHREALRLIEDSIARRKEVGDLQGDANSRVNLGLVHLELWNLGRARELFRSAADAARDLGTRSVLGEALMGLADVALREGRLPDGYRRALEARRVFKALGQEPDIACCEILLARLAAARGRFGGARARLARALRRLRRTGTAWLVVQAHALAGHLRGCRGGEASFRAALRIADRCGFREAGWRVRMGLGLLLAGRGEREEGAVFVRQAMELLRELTRDLPPEMVDAYLSDPAKQELRATMRRLLPLLGVPAS